jgi:catechol 2,3-dioxygenase
VSESIDPGADIGHVHLKVADLERAIGFYRDVLGFDLMQRMGDRAALADALKRLVDNQVPISGASDHGVSEAIYLNDPDGNGIELYRDRPREEWPMAPDGKGVAMVSIPLDLDALLAEAE